jgi:hypothetical protein
MKLVSRMLGAALCAMGLVGVSASAGAGSSHHAPPPKVYHGGGHHGGHHGGGHHGGGRLITIGGPQINVGDVNVYSGGMSAASSVSISNASSNVTVYGGGGGSYVNYTKVPEYIEGLEVVTVTRGTGLDMSAVRADCVSPDGERMPAARTGRSGLIEAARARELFRCEAGLELHAFIGAEMHGDLSHASGQTFVCRTGQSLWADKHGGLVCRAKRHLACWTIGRKAQCNCDCTARAPRRLACTEAQLRHAFGVDAVMIAARRQIDVEEVHVTRGLSLNGGVGLPPM